MLKGAVKHIEEFLQANRDPMIRYLEGLVKLESPTERPDLQQPIFVILKKSFIELGFDVTEVPGNKFGGYLIAKPKKRRKFKPIQLLIGHCDTVWPEKTLLEMPFLSQNGKIRGPGVYDMKAGLTQIVFALKAIQSMDIETDVTPVIIINSDEEQGSRESTSGIQRMARIASRAFILEPPLGLDGKLKTARKGLGRFTLTVKGQPAHAGLDPSKGASAILELSHQIQKLFELNDLDRGISVNVGMIEGGTRANVIAPISKAVVDVRVLTHEDAQFVTEKIRSLQPVNLDTTIEIEGGIGRPPMERTMRNKRLWQAAYQVGKEIGINLEQATAGGGSDGNTTSLFTATLDGLGTTGDGAHAHHEFIYTDMLVERTVLLTHLILMKNYEY